MKTSRREFIKVGTAAVLSAGAVTTVGVKDAEAAAKREFSPEAVGMFYDSTKCIGCQACVISCYEINFLNRESYINNVIAPEDQNFIVREDLIPKLAPGDQFNPDRPWLNVETNDYRFRNIIQKYVDPEDNVHFIKHQCMHCNHPECVSVCPVAALTKDPVDGVVEYNASYCIGCRYCQLACPFLIPKYEWKRAVPKIVKCDMCKSTLGANGISGTGCTNVCPTGAVIYGKRVDLMEDAKSRISNNPGKYFADKVYGEYDNGGTDVIYLSAVDFKYLGFDERIQDYSYAAVSEKLHHTIYTLGIAPIGLFLTLAVVGYINGKRNAHDSFEGVEFEDEYVEDVKTSDSKVSGAKTTDTKVADSKAKEVKAKDVKAKDEKDKGGE